MKKILLGAIVVALITTFGCSTVNAAWHDDFVGKIEGKAGFLCIANNANEVMKNAGDVEWDQCVSLEILKWRKFNFDAGVSRAGVIYGSVSHDLLNLKNIWNFPGSEYLTLSVGLYAGKDIDAIDGLCWDEDLTAGIVINLFDIDADTEKN
jgi:hypothetical protein